MRYLLLLAFLLSACTAADGKTYVVVEQNAVQQAAYNAAFLMCIELTARAVGPVVQASEENTNSVMVYCANELISQFGAEPTPVPSGDDL